MNELNNFINNILKQVETKVEFLNIKNINIKTISLLKIKINNSINSLSKFCIIQKNEKNNFLLSFNNNTIMNTLIKNNYFTNYGFIIFKKKNELELQLPKISVEFRNKFLKIIKNEQQYYYNLLESKRKAYRIKFLNLKSNDEKYLIEKKIDKIILEGKIKMKKIIENSINNILNE